MGLTEYPAFYMELSVNDKKSKDNDKKALELEPVYLSYAASSAKTLGSARKHVSVVIAMSDAAPKVSGELEEEKAFAVFRHDFGRLDIGKSYNVDTLKGTTASQPPSEKFNQEVFNISALVTESEGPSIARQALIDAFNNKKGDLQSALEQAIKNAFGGEEEKK